MPSPQASTPAGQALVAGHDRLLTTDQLSVMLAEGSEDTLRGWRARRIGPAHFKLGGKVYYRASKVAEWIDAQEAAGMRGQA